MNLNASQAELVLIAATFTGSFKMAHVTRDFEQRKKKKFSNLIYPLCDAGVFARLGDGYYEPGPAFTEALEAARAIDLDAAQAAPRLYKKRATAPSPPPPPALNISNSAQDFLEQTSMLIKENADLRQALTEIRNTVDHLLGE